MALTNCVAIDCEMAVGYNNESILVRVAVVNEYGETLLHTYVKPSKSVKDYLPAITGIRSERDLMSGEQLQDVKRQIANMINNRVLIGHSLDVDLSVLGLNHPEGKRRDLGQYPPFKRMNGGQPASLKFLASRLLGRCIQNGVHSPVEDAKASMDIYRKVAHEWAQNA